MKDRPDSLTLILGGARSGKSTHAEALARAAGSAVLFIATAQPLDQEMHARIQKHRAARPPDWNTLEIPTHLGSELLGRALNLRDEVVILDCITLLVSNVMLTLSETTPAEDLMQAVRAEIESLLDARRKLGGRWLVISNEVGMGVVPVYPLGRDYRDALGWANQRIADAADQVILMVAGIPMVIK